MSGGSSQPSTQTVEQVSDPWSGAQPYLRDVMQDAQNLYRGNIGREYAPFDTVVPFAPQTQAGLQLQENLATSGNPLIGSAISSAQSMMGPANDFVGSQQLTGMASGGMGYNPTAPISNMANGQLDQLSQAASGIYNTAAQGGMNNMYRGGMGAFAGPGSRIQASDFLMRDASGMNLGSNPYLEQMYNRSAEDVTDRINAQFSGAGRYGSPAHTQALAESLGDMRAGMFGQAYEGDRNRQLQAASQIGSFQGQDLGRQLGAMGALSGLDAQDRARQLQGATALQGLGAQAGQFALAGNQANQSAINDNASRIAQGATTYGSLYGQRQQQALGALAMMPQIQDARFDDARRLSQVGTARENLAREQIGDRLNRWNFQQSRPWELLGQYSGMVNGMGALGGTSTQTGPNPNRTSPLMGGLGGASAGAGIASALGLAGPAGWAVAGLGGLLGAFG